MAINLDKHRESLVAAWKDVLDDKSKTDWALFGYEGQSNDLKVVGKGTGGIEEMIDDFNSGKIMYAYCKVMDPTTSLPKCVLINWQGEGAPIVRKGTCANHIRDVGNLFKGAHVTLHARNEEEVDPQLIIDKVAKSTGSAYSFKERGELETGSGSGPVGTTYKRVVPQQEINSKERDKFWEKEENEEKQRQAEERQRRDVERTKLEDERKQRELTEAALREQKIQARSNTITQQREAEKHAEVAHVEKPYQDERNEDDERKGRSDILRRQRSQEAQSVISKRTFDARAIFEQNTSAGQMHQSRRASLNQQAKNVVTSPLTSSHAEPQPANSRKASLPSWPPSSPEPQNPCPEPSVPSPVITKNGILKPTSQAQSEPYSSLSPTEESYEAEKPIGNGVSNPMYASNPIGNAGNENIVTAVPYSPCNPSHANSTHPSPTEVVRSPVEQKKVVFQEPEEQLYEDTSYSNQPTQSQYPEEVEQEWATGGTDDYNGADELGLQARALYDYQAADATELTFDPGDIITHIDQIDEGWWQGLGPDGIFGLFPANYVELINV